MQDCRKWVLTPVGLLVTFVLPALADAGSIRGVIFDASRGVLPGASLVLSPAAESSRDPVLRVSDAQGRFEFVGLAPGGYVLSVSLPGFQEKTVPVEVEEGGGEAAEDVEIVLDVATLSETVTVREKVKLADVRQPSGESKVEEKVLEAAPLVEERFQDALPLLPGVVRGPDGLLNMNGARSHQSGFLLNGANVTDPVTGDFAFNLPLDAVQSVQVYQSVYSAEFGKITSGLSNVLTRAGADSWKLTFNNFFPRPRFKNGGFRGFDSFTPRMRVSGPLIPGKLWMSQALNYRFVRSRVDELPLEFSEEILESFDSITQIDYQPSARHLLTGTVSFFPSDIDNLGINTLRDFAASPDLETRGFHVSLGERATLSQGSVLETLLSLQSFDLEVAPKLQAPARLMVTGPEGNYFNRVDRDSLRVELSQSLATEVRDRLGDHTLKIGYTLSRTSYEGSDHGLPVDVFRADGTRFLRIEWRGGDEVGASNTEFSAYVQDRWRPAPGIQLDVGVRYDHERIAGDHHVAPRLSFAVSPFAGGKTVFKGGFGLFYDKIALNARDYGRRERRVLTYFGSDGLTPAGPPLEFLNTVGGGRLDVPRSANWHLEMDRMLGSRLMLRAKYGERHGSHELVIDPLPSAADGPELRLTSRGRSRTRELEVTVRAEFGAESQLFFSYVRAKTEGDLNDFNSIFGNLRDPIVLANEFSLQPFDTRNRFLMWGVVNLPRKIVLSPVLEVRGGFPYTVVDEEQNPVGGRNRAGRFPTLFSLDLKVTKEIRLFRKTRAQVGLQFFNLLDHFNPRDVQNNLGSPLFGAFANGADRSIRGKFVLVF